MQFPQFDLAGQVSLVTGAARGLGRSISLALAHAGSDVALGLRDIHSPGTLVGEIETLGRKALPLQMDVTNLDQIFRAVQQTCGPQKFRAGRFRVDVTLLHRNRVLGFEFFAEHNPVHAACIRCQRDLGPRGR